MLVIHKTSDLKSAPGKLLDAAKTSPQYVMRDGVLFVVQRVDKLSPQRPEGQSAWDALKSGAGLSMTFPRMMGRVRRIKL